MDTKNISREIFKQYCKLCGHITSSDDVKIIDDVMKSIFNVLLLNLTFEDETQHVLCRVCSSKIMAALNFKSTCIYTDNYIIPFVDSKYPALVDLKEVYAKKEGSDQANSMVEDQKICRLCLKPISGEDRSLQDLPFDNVKILIPEINFKVTADPIFCINCLDSLLVHSTFLKKCSGLQQEINTKQNGVDDTILFEPCIKMEEIEIKSEEVDEPSEPGIKIRHEGSSTKWRSTTIPLAVPKNKCAQCEYETVSVRQFARHVLQHEISSEVQVDEPQKSKKMRKYRSKIKGDQLNRKNTSELEMHTLALGSHETKEDSLPSRLQLMDTETSVVKMFKCNKCPFNTAYKGDLAVHQLRCINPSRVSTYLCDKSGFKCIDRSRFITHKQAHKSLSYICTECAYKTKNKEDLMVHQLRHKYPSKVRVNSCDKSEHNEVAHKGLPEAHQDPSRVLMYKCSQCSFKTKCRDSLKPHALSHKNILQRTHGLILPPQHVSVSRFFVYTLPGVGGHFSGSIRKTPPNV